MSAAARLQVHEREVKRPPLETVQQVARPPLPCLMAEERVSSLLERIEKLQKYRTHVSAERPLLYAETAFPVGTKCFPNVVDQWCPRHP